MPFQTEIRMGDLERETRTGYYGKNKNRLRSDENNCQSLARTPIAPMVTPNTIFCTFLL
jgi:hypothetical protein